MSSSLDLTPELRPQSLPEAWALIDTLRAELQRLQAQLAELQNRLQQNSTNSSKPPSSDPPHLKRRPPATPSGRQRGGQPKHRRHTRPLVPSEQYDGLSRTTRASDNGDPSDPSQASVVTQLYDSLSRMLEEGQQIGAAGTMRYVTGTAWTAEANGGGEPHRPDLS